MDDTGLDVAVVSMTTPGLQNLDSREMRWRCRLSATTGSPKPCVSHPDRLQGFATLATPDPDAASAELGRAVTELGFNGAMLYGRTRDRNLDHPDFWPIFEAAEALNAPLYLHPQSPPPAVRSCLLQRTRRRQSTLRWPRTDLVGITTQACNCFGSSSAVCSTAFPVCS